VDGRDKKGPVIHKTLHSIVYSISYMFRFEGQSQVSIETKAWIKTNVQRRFHLLKKCVVYNWLILIVNVIIIKKNFLPSYIEFHVLQRGSD